MCNDIKNPPSQTSLIKTTEVHPKGDLLKEKNGKFDSSFRQDYLEPSILKNLRKALKKLRNKGS